MIDKRSIIIQYQRKYKQILFVQYIAVIIYCLFIVRMVFFELKSFRIYVIVMITLLIFGAILLGYLIQKQYLNNVDRIFHIVLDDLEIDKACDIYETLMKGKKRKDYRYILFRYLNILILKGEFDTFQQVYKENQKYIQQSLGKSISNFEELFVFLKPQDDIKQEMYEKHHFSKYHHTSQTLSRRKALLRFNDESFEITYLYYTKQYEQVLEKIDAAHPISSYHQLLLDCYQILALYQLNQDIVEDKRLQELSSFFCVQKVNHLLETGEDIKLQNASDLSELLHADFQINNKKVKRALLIFCIMFVFYIAMVVSLYLYHGTLKYVDFSNALQRFDYQIEETYNFYEDDEMAVGIFYGKKEGMGVKLYYLASFHVEDGFIESRYIESIGWMLDESKVYVHEVEDKNYVCIAIEAGETVYYDNQKQDVTESEIPVFGGETQIVASFIVEGTFDETLITKE